MQLHHIEAARCGALTDLRVLDLAPGLNVVLGPNGSGKTSLLRFVRELLRDAAERTQAPLARPAAAGSVEIQSAESRIRIVRVERQGHPDTVATIASTSEDINQVFDGTADSQVATLIRFVESSALHQCPALATLADQLTHELCSRELGADWSVLQSLPVLQTADAPDDTPLMHVIRRLAGTVNHAGVRLKTIESNWSMVVGTLSRQREQLRLEWEATVRAQTQQQQEWDAQWRWLRERSARELQEIAQLEADWQSAAADLKKPQAMTAVGRTAHQPAVMTRRLAHDSNHSVLLLEQVLEDLAHDRLQAMLEFAQTPESAAGAIETELLRIDRCEREVVTRIQHLRRRHGRHSEGANGCVCPTCGTPQTVQALESAPERPDGALQQRVAELQQSLATARDEHAITSRRLARLDALRRRAADDDTADRLRFDLSALDAQLEDLQQRQRVDLAAWAIAVRRDLARRHDVLRQAGRNLATLTSGRYASVRWSTDHDVLLAGGPSGERTQVDALSRGTSEQVALALRLAVLRALSELGRCGPVLWDEPLPDSDEERLGAAAALLAECGVSGTQIVLFTCREHVALAMQSVGACLHQLGAARSLPSQPTVAPAVDAGTEPSIAPITAEAIAAPVPISMRLLPGSAHWLRTDSPVDQVPSIGQQMARRLSAFGVADIRDLLEFDPRANAVSLADVQVTAAHIHIWQAEARLLTEVPELTGRDAQLLVSCGVMTRSELATANVDDLTRRIDRLRGGETLRWRMGPSTAPHRETIERWVAAALGFPPADPATRTTSVEQVRGANRRRRARAALRRSQHTRSPAPASPPAVASRFRLQPDSPIVDAPSIGHKTASRLQRVGILTVRDLLACDPKQTANRLRHRRINADTVLAWQQQAGLMCSVPDLRCADAIVLVACGVTGPLDLRRISASALQATLEPFIADGAGQRLLRGATPPTSEDMTRWIETVEESRVRRAA